MFTARADGHTDAKSAGPLVLGGPCKIPAVCLFQAVDSLQSTLLGFLAAIDVMVFACFYRTVENFNFTTKPGSTG